MAIYSKKFKRTHEYSSKVVVHVNNTIKNHKFTHFSFWKKIYQHWYIPAIASLLLAPISLVNMALFHTLTELFAIAISVMSFVVAWNTFPFSRNRMLLFLGCGYFWVGIIDLLHTLSFKDVVIIQNIEGGVTIQFWIIARLFESIILLLAPLALTRSINPKYLFVILGMFFSLAIGAVLTGFVPTMYIPGEGLTNIKIVSEYIIISMLVMAMIGYLRQGDKLEKETKQLLLISIVLTIFAELCFTLYMGLGELPIVLGHIFKLLSFWAIYIALIEFTLLKPFKSLTDIVTSYDTTLDATVVVDEFGKIHEANKMVRDKSNKVVIGLNCHDVLHPASINVNDCPICQSIADKLPMQGFEFEDPDNHCWYEASLSGIHFSNEYSAMVHTLRDITARKHDELKFISLNRLYRVLTHSNQAITRTPDRDVLLQRICDIAIEYGGFEMVWIGRIEGVVVKPLFFAGAESGYLRKTSMRTDDSQWSKGPVGIAVKRQAVSCVNNVKTDPDFAPWRAAAIKRGYASLAAVPLNIYGQVVAVFTLYSTQEGFFDDDMLSLLRSLSDDISTALFHIEQVQLKVQAESNVQKLSRALEQSADAVVITDSLFAIEYVNHRFIELTGYRESEVIGKNIAILQADTDEDSSLQKMLGNLSEGVSWRGETLSRKKNGDTYWSMQSISPIKNERDEITNFVATSVDNSKLHEAQETIQKLAFYDPLTKLANRRLLMDRLDHDIKSAKRHGEQVAVLLCDLDNFKMVNDSLGHDSGDFLLQHVSNILKQNVRTEDTVARLGGDEFTLVVSGIKGESCIIDIADSILTDLQVPIVLAGNQVAISSSIGIALYPQDGLDPKELLRSADLAMYHAKDEGKNGFQFYQLEMNEKAQNRMILENKLKLALEFGEFELFYQPQVNILDGSIVGLEALIRWNDKDSGIVTPDKFIPLAEECGLISLIGDWVIKQAYQDWQDIYNMGFQNINMAVNVAAYQFRNPGQLCEAIGESIIKYPNCPASHFTVELTESTLIKDIDTTINTLNALKKLGVRISIDDFGTGYSSLNYLKEFPIDQLKIDRSFVKDLLDDTKVGAITAAIIVMAKKLEMKVVAEGIEEPGQSEILLEQGCEFAQGFLYYKPMSLAELKKLGETLF